MSKNKTRQRPAAKPVAKPQAKPSPTKEPTDADFGLPAIEEESPEDGATSTAEPVKAGDQVAEGIVVPEPEPDETTVRESLEDYEAGRSQTVEEVIEEVAAGDESQKEGPRTEWLPPGFDPTAIPEAALRIAGHTLGQGIGVVTIAVPITQSALADDGRKVRKRIYAELTTRQQSIVMGGIRDALHQLHSQTADGKHVETLSHTVRWLIEQVALAIEGAGGGPAPAGSCFSPDRDDQGSGDE